MRIFGDRKFVEVPGDGVYELPPLLLKSSVASTSFEGVVHRAESMIESDWLIPDNAPADAKAADDLEARRLALAVNLAEQYAAFLAHWEWGESIAEWIRQCEITFGAKPMLRPLLRPDVWPHAGRASFVTLLNDKKIPRGDVNLENAMGYRLTFRQPPPIHFFSDKALMFLNASLAHSAFTAWAGASGEVAASLPPERFQFMVMGTEIREV